VGDPVIDDGEYTFLEKEIGVWVGGKRKIITVADDLLARQITNLGTSDMPGFLRATGKITRVLAAMATKWNPGFMLPNFVRDFGMAAINLTGEQGGEMARKVLNPARIARALQGAWQAARDPDATGEWVDRYRRYEASGAPVGVFEIDTPAEQGRNLQRLMDEVDPTPLKRARMLLLDSQHGLFKLLEDANVAVENAVRFSAFDAALEMGATEQQAASLAKNLTVNFNRRGEWGPNINALFMFFSAGANGTARVIKSLKNPKVQKIVAGVASMAVVMDVINRMVAGDDDDGENFYDKIPQYIKERNLIVMFGDGDYLKIPLPWGFNVFWDAGTQLSAAIHGPQTAGEAASHLLSTMYSAFNPLGGEASLLQTISPTITDPLAQQAENKTFYGAPIRPKNYPFGLQKPESQLYWQSTNPMAVEVTQWLNEVTGGTMATSGAIDINPELVEHWVEFLTGGSGKFLSRGTKSFVHAVRGTKVFLKDVPILRRFAGEADPRYVPRKFYDNLREVEQLDLQIKELRGAGEVKEANRLKADNLHIHGMLSTAKEARKRVRALRDSGQEDVADRVMRNFNRRFIKGQRTGLYARSARGAR